MGEDGEIGKALVNDGSKQPPCRRCGRTNHILDKCIARRHADRTMLHNMGDIDKTEYEMKNEGSTEISTKNGDLYCNNEGILFQQPDVNSLKDQLSTPSKRVGIPKTWILIDSQFTIDVFCNGEIFTQIHETNIILRIRCNAGVKTRNLRGHLSGIGWMWFYS
jgi:hypothetical protein